MSAADMVFIARTTGIDAAVQEKSTEDSLYDPESTKWIPDTLFQELQKTRIAFRDIAKVVEKTLAKGGPEFEISILERHMSRLLQISSLAQRFLVDQNKKTTKWLSFGIEECAAIANQVTTSAFATGVSFDFSMLYEHENPPHHVWGSNGSTVAQAAAVSAEILLGSKVTKNQEDLQKASQIDTLARELYESIHASITEWKIKAAEMATEVEKILQLEACVQNMREDGEPLPSVELIAALLSGYKEEILQQVHFSRTLIGDLFTRAAHDAPCVRKERAAVQIQRRWRSRRFKADRGEISVIVDTPSASKRTGIEMLQRLIQSLHMKTTKPNIGVTIEDWMRSVAKARRAVEMYIMFIAKQRKNGAVGLIDFHPVVEFFCEQACIVNRALELVDAEKTSGSSILCHKWVRLGINSSPLIVSFILNLPWAKTKKDDPFDETRIAIAMCCKISAFCSKYALERFALRQRRIKRKEELLKNLADEAKDTKKFIAGLIKRYGNFIDPKIRDRALRREASSTSLRSVRRSAVQHHATRDVVDRMVDKAHAFRIGEDGMVKEEYLQILIAQYKKRFPALAANDFNPKEPIEVELFKAFIQLYSKRNASAQRGGTGMEDEAVEGRISSSELVRRRTASDERVGSSGLGDMAETMSDERLRQLVQENRLSLLIEWMARQIEAAPDEEKKRNAAMILMKRYQSYLDICHFDSIKEEQRILLEAFFRLGG